MRLRVLLPTKVLIDEPARKVVAEAANGSFGLLPRHVDFVAPLVAGLLSFEADDGTERFLAVDQGILVKNGPEVVVSTRRAVCGGDLGELRETIEREFLSLEEREKLTRSALARLESDIVRRFMELGRLRHEQSG
ncbi:MAG: F0F1 ATP synthase subunit epsilon [Armatimonadetes bacterium]|nr:F0F1 ATP synthase subunit epsilon [Gemmatimonadales bacterium]NIO75924.1 F0F1 ATP synthase subunit epsilon [Armatimonadota bacterium]